MMMMKMMRMIALLIPLFSLVHWTHSTDETFDQRISLLWLKLHFPSSLVLHSSPDDHPLSLFFISKFLSSLSESKSTATGVKQEDTANAFNNFLSLNDDDRVLRAIILLIIIIHIKTEWSDRASSNAEIQSDSDLNWNHEFPQVTLLWLQKMTD